MSKIFTYIRNNENNLKYTQEQKNLLDEYLQKNNIKTNIMSNLLYILFIQYVISLNIN